MFKKIVEIKEFFNDFHINTHEFYSDNQMVKKEIKISSNNFRNDDDKLSLVIEFSQLRKNCYCFMFLHASGSRYKDLFKWDFADNKHHIYYSKCSTILGTKERDRILSLVRNELKEQ